MQEFHDLCRGQRGLAGWLASWLAGLRWGWILFDKDYIVYRMTIWGTN